MTRRFFLSLLPGLFATFPICSYGGNATFTHKSVAYKIDSNIVGSFNRCLMIVNGVKISVKDKVFKVPLNEKGLDTIRMISDSPFYSKTVIAKLKAGETYEFTFNPCSFFEIIPKTKVEHDTRLVRLITLNRDSNKMYLESGYCFIDAEQIHHRDTTDYFYNAWSGMCRYSVDYFGLGTKEDPETKDDYASVKSIYLYFPTDGMFSLIYDHKTKELKVKFDGYYTKKKKIRIADIKE